MARFLVISDIHAHPFPYGAQYVPYHPFKGLHNSRLVSTMRALEGVADYAVANGVGTVLFVGDMFHTRQSVRTVARNMVTHVIKEKFVDQGIKMVLIPGNHDYADRVGNIHSLQSLSYLGPDIHVVDTVSAVELPDMRVICVPYTDSVKKARLDLQDAAGLAKQDLSKLTVLLCHLGVQGATVGSDYVMVCPSDVGGEEIPFADFDLCFFGHYHQHQMLAKNAWFTGALTEQNWSDVNGTRGFIHVDNRADSSNFRCNDGFQIREAKGKRSYSSRGGEDGEGGSGGGSGVGSADRGSSQARSLSLFQVATDAPRFLLATCPEDLDAPREEDFVTYYTTETLTPEQQAQLRQRCKALQLDIKPLKKDKALELTFDATQLNAETALPPWVKENAGDLEQGPLLELGRELLSEAQGNAIQ